MDYKKNDVVKHPELPEWLDGLVLENSKEDSVRIFFHGAGERTLSLKHVQPVKVPDQESRRASFDNLMLGEPSSGIKYQSLSQSIQIFLEQYPGGFYGERFQKDERNYKDEANVLAHKLLGEDPFRALLKEENYSEITRRALQIVSKTNLIFPQEKISLKNGLKDSPKQKAFSEALFSLLHCNDSGDLEGRFSAFANVLEGIDAGKWTIATYFSYIMHPKHCMFVKPSIIKETSELCRFEVNYQSKLNWVTYSSILRFADRLFRDLEELEPRDMIDVQSFMWCISPSYK